MSPSIHWLSNFSYNLYKNNMSKNTKQSENSRNLTFNDVVFHYYNNIVTSLEMYI